MVTSFYFSSIFFILTLTFSESTILTDEDYKKLPPIFHIDSPEKCSNNSQFAKILIKLAPTRKKSTSWKLIQATKSDVNYYNHDELFHSICVKPNTTAQELDKIYTKKYEKFGLKAAITKIQYDQDLVQLKFIDISIQLALFAYLVLVIGATLADQSKLHRFVTPFSIRHNLATLRNSYAKPQFQRLKCVQGLRFYTTVLVISIHTFCSFAGGFVNDTLYLEQVPNNWFKHGLRILSVFVVQSFFLISGWLLSFNTFQLIAHHTQSQCIKYLSLTFVNRYFRIVPPVLIVMLMMGSTWMYDTFHGPVTALFVDPEFIKCRKNWWVNLLFLNNHLHRTEMCYLTTWYLAADTQLYACALLILALAWKYPRWRLTILVSAFLAGVGIQALVTYLYELDIIYRLTPTNTQLLVLKTFEFSATYTSTYTNSGTFMLGVLFGYFFHNFESYRAIFKRYEAALLFVLLLLPATVLYVSSYRFSPLLGALVAGVLRPLYALGVGIAVLGMSERLWPALRAIFEWRPAVFLANFSYCTYVIHFSIVFRRTALATSPLNISNFIIFTAFVQDVILAFACGFLLHVLVEMPCGQLQALLVPNIKTEIKKKEL